MNKSCYCTTKHNLLHQIKHLWAECGFTGSDRSRLDLLGMFWWMLELNPTGPSGNRCCAEFGLLAGSPVCPAGGALWLSQHQHHLPSSEGFWWSVRGSVQTVQIKDGGPLDLQIILCYHGDKPRASFHGDGVGRTIRGLPPLLLLLIIILQTHAAPPAAGLFSSSSSVILNAPWLVYVSLNPRRSFDVFMWLAGGHVILQLHHVTLFLLRNLWSSSRRFPSMLRLFSQLLIGCRLLITWSQVGDGWMNILVTVGSNPSPFCWCAPLQGT